MAFGSNNPKVVVEVLGDAKGYAATLQNALDQTAGLGQKFKQIGSNLGQIGRSMTAAFTVPIVGAAIVVGKELENLDKQLHNIQSIAPDINIDDLRKDLIELSRDGNATVETASALAEAMYFVQSAGFEGAEGLEVLKVATMAASAGLTDTTTAANAIMGAFRAYEGITSKTTGELYDMEYISDILFKTVDAGVITFEEIAKELGRLTNVGAVAGVSLEEIGASLVTLTRKGMPAAEAVTALNQVMSKLVAPTDRILERAKELGIDLSYSRLQADGFGKVLADIASHGDEAFFKLFGNNVRALKGIVGLATNDMALYNESMKEMETASGRTAEAFGIQTNSMSAELAKLRNDFMGMSMTLLQELMPAFKELVAWLGKAVDWFGNLNPTTQKWILALVALLAIAGPLLMILGSLVTVIGAIMTIVGVISAPIWIVIAAIVALIAVLGLVYLAWRNNWFGMRDTTTAVVAYIKNLWTTFMDWYKMLTTGQLGNVSRVWQNVMGSIKLIITTILGEIRLYIQAFRYAMEGDWYNFGATLRRISDAHWLMLKMVFKAGMDNLKIIMVSIINSILSWWHNIDWSSLGRDIGRGILNGLNSMGSALYNAIRNIARNMLYTFQGYFGIRSPSSVMFEQFAFLAKGAMMGWDQTFMFSPQSVNSQMMSMYNTPQTYTGDSNGRVVSLLEQLNSKDSRIDEGVLVRAFRDAVLLLRD